MSVFEKFPQPLYFQDHSELETKSIAVCIEFVQFFQARHLMDAGPFICFVEVSLFG